MTKRRIKKRKKDFIYTDSAANIARLRCVWHTRLIIPADQTATGTRYEFRPGEIKEVAAEDNQILLAMEKRQKSCCGGNEGQSMKFFEPA